jgi:hypothetical protein
MFRCLHQRPDRVITARALAAAEVHLAFGGEGIAIVAVSAGVGCRRMTRDQMIDGEPVLDRAQAILQWCTHMIDSSCRRAG